MKGRRHAPAYGRDIEDNEKQASESGCARRRRHCAWRARFADCGQDLYIHFRHGSGGAYCDGITFTNGGSGDIWSGNLLGSCGDNSGVGGFTVKGETTLSIELSTVDSADPGTLESFLIQPKTLRWYLYINQGFGFVLVNEGDLTKGAPPIAKDGAKSSIFKNPKALNKPVL